MAVKITIMDPPGGYKDDEGVLIRYQCDSADDVSDLPTGADETNWRVRPRPGSEADVLTTGNTYVLNSARTWVQLP